MEPLVFYLMFDRHRVQPASLNRTWSETSTLSDWFKTVYGVIKSSRWTSLVKFSCILSLQFIAYHGLSRTKKYYRFPYWLLLKDKSIVRKNGNDYNEEVNVKAWMEVWKNSNCVYSGYSFFSLLTNGRMTTKQCFAVIFLVSHSRRNLPGFFSSSFAISRQLVQSKTSVSHCFLLQIILPVLHSILNRLFQNTHEKFPVPKIHIILPPFFNPIIKGSR